MAECYVGEIRMFGGTFAPVGWLLCDGQLHPISQYESLFALLGTTYGGDGQSSFGVPDMRGRVPLHPGNGIVQGQTGGVEQVTLAASNIAPHSHAFMASEAAASDVNPAGHAPAIAAEGMNIYRAGSPSSAMAAGAIGPNSGGQPHDNVAPFLCVNFIIAHEGIYPTPP